MKINVPLRRKDKEIETNPCVIEKTVELSADWFDHFSENLLNDYDFILENTDCMYQDQNGINHCLLHCDENRSASFCISAQAVFQVGHFFPGGSLYGNGSGRTEGMLYLS